METRCQKCDSIVVLFQPFLRFWKTQLKQSAEVIAEAMFQPFLRFWRPFYSDTMPMKTEKVSTLLEILGTQVAEALCSKSALRHVSTLLEILDVHDYLVSDIATVVF